MGTTIVWFRRDLRLGDNPALHAALKRAAPIIPVYIHAPTKDTGWDAGGACRWWLYQSLAALDAALRKRGSRLVLRYGPVVEVLRGLAKENHADAVLWNRVYEPRDVSRDSTIEHALQKQGLVVHTFNSALINEPWEITRDRGKPFRIFTHYWHKSAAGSYGHARSPAPSWLAPVDASVSSVSLDALGLLSRTGWHGKLERHWQPGEAGARKRLTAFIKTALGNYSVARDRPDQFGTSRLSPHLHFGEIAPWQVVRAVRKAAQGHAASDADAFIRQLSWREFAYHLLYHFPDTPEAPMDRRFERFPWKVDDASQLKRWQRGETGIPLVDAGMRELWETGWMHNRVRMIAASFLTKNLLIPWQQGARWFWDTLVDADLANNTLGWQWVAGCGADAAPFFRIFNPVLQGQRFDPDGTYVRRWLPALQRLPNRYIHCPWQASAAVLSEAGLRLGREYPEPMVNLLSSRARALAAFNKIRNR